MVKLACQYGVTRVRVTHGNLRTVSLASLSVEGKARFCAAYRFVRLVNSSVAVSQVGRIGPLCLVFTKYHIPMQTNTKHPDDQMSYTLMAKYQTP